jgi:hypothetical protein
MTGLTAPISPSRSVPCPTASNHPACSLSAPVKEPRAWVKIVAFKKAFWDRDAVDREKRVGGSVAQNMDGFGKHLFSRAGLAEHQYVHVRLGASSRSSRQRIKFGLHPRVWI